MWRLSTKWVLARRPWFSGVSLLTLSALSGSALSVSVNAFTNNLHHPVSNPCSVEPEKLHTVIAHKEREHIILSSINGPMQVVAEELDTGDRSNSAGPQVDAATAKETTTKMKSLRPAFLPAYAFTCEEMVAPYRGEKRNRSILEATEKFPLRIKLDPAIARHWPKATIDSVWVKITPVPDHSGSYKFVSENSDGPRGWLVRTSECSAWGDLEYRYWFNPQKSN